MKYSKLHTTADGKFRVMQGTTRAFTPEFEVEAEALEFAAALSAKFYIQQAKDALEKVENWEVAQQVGHDVVALLEEVLQPMHEKSDSFDSQDTVGWRC